MAIAEMDAGSVVNLKNPFPGLRPFEVDESDLFFGRDDYVYELLRLLRRNRFLAVVGSSGCGKSSVVRAGLIASLRDGFLVEGDGEWRIAIMRPGGKPIMELAKTLCHEDALGPLLEQGEETLALVHATLRRGASGILEVTREASLPAAAKLLILVDQFEELFRFMQSATMGALDEAQAFVKLLLEAAEQRDLPVYVVLTMRSEFLGQCAPLPGLADAINQGLYLLPSMTRDQLREAIQEPITAHEGTITNRLVNRLLNDLGSNIDQLPILQHALMRLWSIWLPDRQHGPMDLEQYQRIGQLESSLSQHAEEAFADLDERQQAIAESLFRQITDTTPDNQTIRRPSTLAAICQRAQASQEEVVAVLEKFCQEGRSFLMLSGDVLPTSDTIIDISHESLIRQWVRLRQWAEAEAQATEVYRRLQESARLWEREGRNEDGLYRGARLAQAVEWREGNEEKLNPLEQEFLTAGVALQKQEQEEEEQHRQRELERARTLAETQRQRADEQAAARIRQRRLSWVLGAVLVLSLGAAFYALQQRKLARIETIRRRISQANTEFQISPIRGLLLAVEALKTSRSEQLACAQQVPCVQSAAEALVDLLSRTGGTPLIGEEEVVALSFSEDGNLLATAERGTARVWRVEQPGTPIAVLPIGDFVPGSGTVSFSPDGKLLATTSFGSVYLYRLDESPTPLHAPFVIGLMENMGGAFSSVSFSKDGKLLLMVSGVQSAELWQVDELDKPIKWGYEGYTSQVRFASFTSDGKFIVTIDPAGKVWQWRLDQLESKGEPMLVVDLKGEFEALSFSADGKRLLILGRPSTKSVQTTWRFIDLDKPATFEDADRLPIGGARVTRGAALSPDGELVAIADDGDTVRVWQTNDLNLPLKTLHGHEGPVYAAAFTADGKSIATAGEDGTVRIWRIDQLMAIANDDKSWESWGTRLDALIQLAGKTAGRNLSREEWLRLFPDEEYHATFPDLPPAPKIEKQQ